MKYTAIVISLLLSTLSSVQAACKDPHYTRGYLAWDCIDEFTETPFEYVDEANDYGSLFERGDLDVEELVYEIYLSKQYYNPLHEAIVRGEKAAQTGWKQDMLLKELESGQSGQLPDPAGVCVKEQAI